MPPKTNDINYRPSYMNEGTIVTPRFLIRCFCRELWKHSSQILWLTLGLTVSETRPLKVHRPVTIGPSLNFLFFRLQQKNTLLQECGFKEMSNVYFVVFVQAEPLHCSLKNHLSLVCPPPIHQHSWREVRCFYKHPGPLQHFISTI